MFRNVPGCSMFRLLSTTVLKAVSQAVDFRATGNDKRDYSDREFDKFPASGHVSSAILTQFI